jgi:cyclopropane fatty-acyl-phospholipid synthase-like methyltransferase
LRLLAQYQTLHKKKRNFHGNSIRHYVDKITDLIQLTNARTLLDYGCGKAQGRKKSYDNWNIIPTLYDPAVEVYSAKPIGKFDGVICTDVMEHVPEEEVDEVLQDIFQYSRRFVLFGISTVPAKKRFPDGTNVHVTVKSRDWWIDRISSFPQKVIIATYFKF